MKTLAKFLFLFTFLMSNAQELDESKNFIYKTDGTIYYGSHIDLRTPMLKANYFELDNLIIKSKEVQFYNSGVDFFGSINDNGKGFARRIIKGKINYFKYTTYVSHAAPIPVGVGFGGVGAVSGGGTSQSFYYNTGYNKLKPANYENLSIALKDNSKSISLLNKHKNAKKKRTLAYVLGGIAMAAGILTSAKPTGETTNSFNPNTGNFETTDVTKLRPVNLAIGLLGFGTIVTTALTSKKKRNYMRQAIEVYNE